MRDLAGKSFIVCGGASGIGRACVEALASEGCTVTVSDVDAGAGRLLADQLCSGGAQIQFVEADAASETDAERLARLAQSRFGAVHGSCYSVGISTVRKPVTAMALDEWQRAIDVNLTGAFLMLRYQLPLIAAAGGGAAVLIASMAAMKGTANASDYCASKAGMVGLMRAAALEMAPAGVRINTVMPGATMTPMLAGATSPEHTAGLIARTPLGRIAEPEEIARTACWLLSDGASFITGATLAADGGMSAL